jgi:hypothetical protein
MTFTRIGDPLTFGTDSRTRIVSAERRSAWRLDQAIGRLGPPSGTQWGAANNALIEIHEDTPPFVQRKYAGSDKLHFQFIDEGITDTAAPNYEQIPVIGRSEGYMSYSGTVNRTVSMELAFCASVDQMDDGTVDMAARAARWIQSLCYPSYSGGGIMYPPPFCRLFLGKWLSERGVITAAPIQYMPPFVGDQTTFEYPMICRVSFEFTVLNRAPLEASDFIPVPRSILNPPGFARSRGQSGA